MNQALYAHMNNKRKMKKKKKKKFLLSKTMSNRGTKCSNKSCQKILTDTQIWGDGFAELFE
jgi:hypothetical protein